MSIKTLENKPKIIQTEEGETDIQSVVKVFVRDSVRQ